ATSRSAMAAASGRWMSMMVASLARLCRCITTEPMRTAANSSKRTAEMARILTRTVIAPRQSGRSSIERVGVPRGDAAGEAALREDQLPDAHLVGAKTTGAALEVQLPHPPERLVVRVLELVPGRVEPLVPRHQRPVVVGALPAMEILEREVRAHRVHDV